MKPCDKPLLTGRLSTGCSHGVIPAFIALVLGAALFSGCTPPDPDSQIGALRVAVLPDESEFMLRQRHGSLLEYLSEQLELPVELIVPDDYDHLIRLGADSKVHLAFYGGVTYLRASEHHTIAPLVMRDVDLKFSSYFIACPESTANSLDGFLDQRFAFGSESSTSGHLMPRYFLLQKGIQPEQFFSEVRYSGAHDTSAYWVRDGKVDLAAVNARIFLSMLEDGRLVKDDIRIIWETPPYADYVWAISTNLQPELKERLMDAFLALSPANPAHLNILQDQHAGGFLPARDKDFEILNTIVRNLERKVPGQQE